MRYNNKDKIRYSSKTQVLLHIQHQFNFQRTVPVLLPRVPFSARRRGRGGGGTFEVMLYRTWYQVPGTQLLHTLLQAFAVVCVNYNGLIIDDGRDDYSQMALLKALFYVHFAPLTQDNNDRNPWVHSAARAKSFHGVCMKYYRYVKWAKLWNDHKQL